MIGRTTVRRSLAMSMHFARHAHDSIRTHLKYGRLTCAHIYNYLRNERERLAVMETLATNVSSGSKSTGLEGCTLKDLVAWKEAGHLTPEEIEKAKKQFRVGDEIQNMTAGELSHGFVMLRLDV